VRTSSACSRNLIARNISATQAVLQVSSSSARAIWRPVLESISQQIRTAHSCPKRTKSSLCITVFHLQTPNIASPANRKRLFQLEPVQPTIQAKNQTKNRGKNNRIVSAPRLYKCKVLHQLRVDHCAAIALAIPIYVTLLSFQRSGLGDIR
jgi:hypothetical protein